MAITEPGVDVGRHARTIRPVPVGVAYPGSDRIPGVFLYCSLALAQTGQQRTIGVCTAISVDFVFD